MATRRERVVLELEDRFSTGMAKAAASAALLNRELDSLSHDSVRTQRSFSDIDRSTSTFGNNAERSGSQIDRLSGRLRVLTDVATVLGPALVPIGAVGVPAIAGLAAQFGFAATAAGVTVLAFKGVGDALTKVNKAAIDPTAANVKAARLAMEQIPPAARKFVDQLHSMVPGLQRIQGIAAQGLFPGVTDGIDELAVALPRVEAIIELVSTRLGSIAADTGESLASDRWLPFLDFIAREAPAALSDMARAAGSTAHAMAELWMGFQPLNDDFSKWLVDATASLDKWAAGLSKTRGFQDFVAYIQDTGPQVADTFAAIAGAVLKIVEAAAPLGGPVLQGVEALAKAISAIADSDIGTPLFTAAAALALLNRTMAITTASRNGLVGLQSRFGSAGAQSRAFGANIRATRADMALLGSTALTAGARTERELARMSAASGRLKATLAPIGKGAALMAGLGIAATGAADGIGLTNTATLALTGTMLAPGLGTAVGAAAGLFLDAKSAANGFSDALKNVDQVVASGSLDAMSAKIAEIQSALNDATHTSGTKDFLGDTFGKIGDALNHPFDIKPGDERVSQAKAAIAEIGGAMNDVAGESRTAGNATDVYGNSLAAVGSDASSTGEKIAALVKNMQDQRKEAVSSFDAETRYREALKAARVQAAKSNAGIKGDSDEAIKNRDTIDALAAAWNNQGAAVKNNKAKFDEAKRNFIETAVAMGVPIKQAERLAKKLLEIPLKKVIGVQFDAVNALTAIKRIKREMAGIPKKVRTDYYVNQVNGFNIRAQGGRDGDPNTPYATGGWTGPGAKYQPAGVVHADEFVFSKEATNGNVAYLEALHRQMRGYADGGLVRRWSAPGPSMSAAVMAGAGIDYDRLAQAMSAVRPMYGDAHFYGDHTQWRRQMELDRRQAGIGGVPV